MSSLRQAVIVWDLPTRLFHWVLAITVVALVVSAKIGGNAMVWHFRFGYLVMTLLAFRLLWGFLGGHWSRFGSFVHGPAALRRFIGGRSLPGEHLDVGHSPLGALSVFGLLAILAAQVGTGLFADDEISNTGPLIRYVSGATSLALTKWHKGFGQWLVIGLAVLHVLAVLYYWLVKRRNLVVPMITGHKPLAADVPASADHWQSRLLALMIVAACAAIVAWIVR